MKTNYVSLEITYRCELPEEVAACREITSKAVKLMSNELQRALHCYLLYNSENAIEDANKFIISESCKITSDV